MAKYKNILKIIDDKEKLADRADEVAMKDLHTTTHTIKLLKETIRANKDLTCLAAPQIGINQRVFCIRFANEDIRAFINPVIVNSEGMHMTREHCISASREHDYLVPRNDRVVAMYQNALGTPESNKFEGFASEIFEQMVNLLDGIIISDIGLEITPEFEAASDEERKAVIDAYVNNLKQIEKDLNKDIESDKDLKQLSDAIKFMNAVSKGEVKLEKDVQPEKQPETNSVTDETTKKE